jgi:MFS transporter, ACS family, glucarate transporter
MKKGAVQPDSELARVSVLALLCGLSMITYLDRVCFGAAAKSIAQELGLSGVEQLKWAFTAFAIAYAIFEVPCGWLGDRYGPKGTLIRIVLWWSACTALTGMVGLKFGSFTFGGLGLLIAIRFLFGAGEAGAYPNITRAIHNWFPASHWERAQGFIWMSGRLAGGLTPLIWAILVTGTSFSSPLVNWRGSFLFFGVIGVAWCVIFAIVFRNHPRDQAGQQTEGNLQELSPHLATEFGAGTPWRRLLLNPSLIALCTLYFLINYGWFFNITYLPSYLQDRFALAPDDMVGAIYKGAPLWVGAIGCICGGYVAGYLSQRLGSRFRGRRTLGFLGMLGCAACWVGALFATNLHVFCICTSLAAFCIDLTLGVCWASCQEIGQRHAAVAAATMNMVGTFGSAVAAWLTGTIVERSVASAAAGQGIAVKLLPESIQLAARLDGYWNVFAAYSAVYVVAALCWLWVRPENNSIEE